MDIKDLEIKKLKDEVKKLLEDIELRARNYMYNMDQLKSTGRKIVYVYKSESDNRKQEEVPVSEQSEVVPPVFFEPKEQEQTTQGRQL